MFILFLLSLSLSRSYSLWAVDLYSKTESEVNSNSNILANFIIRWGVLEFLGNYKNQNVGANSLAALPKCFRDTCNFILALNGFVFWQTWQVLFIWTIYRDTNCSDASRRWLLFMCSIFLVYCLTQSPNFFHPFPY